MKAIAVFCVLAIFAITFVQCERPSFRNNHHNLTHNKTGLPHFAHHNRTVQVPHFPKFNKTHGIKPAFPHFNKTVLRHSLRADEAEEDEFFFWRKNSTQTNKTHHANKTAIRRDDAEEDEFFFWRKNSTQTNKTQNANKTHIRRDDAEEDEFFFWRKNSTQTNKTHNANKTHIRRDDAEDEELFSFFGRNISFGRNKTHGAKPFGLFRNRHNKTHQANKTHGAFPKLNKTALRRDDAEEDEFFFWRKNSTQTNKTHNANKTHIRRDDAEEDEFFFWRKNTTQTNKTHNANKTHIRRDDAEEDEFFFWRKNSTQTNKTHNANKTHIRRDDAEDEELFSFFGRNISFGRNKAHQNKTHQNKTHHANKTHGAFPKFNKTSLLRKALKADEIEDEELFSFFRRNNKTHQANKTHHANKTHGAFPRHNLTHTNKTHQSNKTHGIKSLFPKFGNKAQLLRHAIKADEVEDEELFSFFRRNATVVAPRHHNKTHHANNTFVPRHNLTHPIIHKNHTNKGFLKF